MTGTRDRPCEAPRFGPRALAAIGTFNRGPLSRRLGAAVCIVIVSVAFRHFCLGVLQGHLIYITLFPSVAVAAVLGGVSGGILATILLALAAQALMAPIQIGMDVAGLIAFLISCALTIVITSLLRQTLLQNAANDLLRESEQQLRQLVEQSPNAMAMLDRDMCYLATNRRYREDYHLDGDILGKSHYEVFPEIPRHWKDNNQRALAGETLRCEREAFTRANGAVQWVRWQVCPWHHPQGDIGGIILFTEEITERVQAREELLASEASLRALGDNLPDSVVYRYAYDPEGKPRFFYISAGIERLNGVSVKEVLADADALHRQILPEHLPKLLEAERASISQKSDFAMDVPMRRPDGEVRWMRLRSRPVIQDDGLTVWHGVQSDVTEQKRVEQALRESEERKSFLLGLADRLKPLEDPQLIMAVASEWLGRSIGGHQVLYAEIDANEAFATVSREWNAGPMPTNIGVHRLVDFGADFIADLKAGKTVVIDDIAKDPRTFSEVAQATFRARSIGGFMGVPLVKNGRLVVVMSVHSRQARHWSALDASLAEETAERTWASIERERAAHEALASKATLEAALSAMTDAVFISDPEGRFLHINDAFATFHKFADKAECAKTLADYPALLDVSTPDGKPAPLEQWAGPRALRGETAVAAEYRLRRKDTGETWLGSYSFAPIRNEQGAIVGSVVTGRDITAQRRAEEDLREHQRRLKAIFEMSMEGIITIDSKGIIQAANPAAAEMFGYGIEEMLGLNVSIFMPETHKARHDAYLAHYLQTGEKTIIGSRRRLQGRRKNGEIFQKELTVSEASIDHEVLFIGFMRDLSPIENERRRVSELRDELARVSRMNDMGEVVAALAHEIGQPLAAIRNYGAVGRRMFQSEPASPVAGLIEKIEMQARRGGDIISRLRQFIEKREVERAPQDLRKLITEAISLATLGSGAHKGPVRLDLLDTEIMVAVDRVQIEQVLVNFLRNAADATALESKPEIIVATAIEKPGFVRVSVYDNGSGVDPEMTDRLFTPFVTTKKFGMGVGLSLCKSIVERHHGEIGFHAKIPQGAEFFFTLPILDRSAE
jgi:PAS domain S-box-containing protein